MTYKVDTAGQIMEKEFIMVPSSFTVANAIAYFRKNATGKNNLHYLYVGDDNNKLCGVLSMRELLVSKEQARIQDVMTKDVISTYADVDQEQLSHVFDNLEDVMSIPVVTETNEMIGVIHMDDILDVVREETTEDFFKMAPVSSFGSGKGGHGSFGAESLKDATISLLYRKRIVWLVVLVFMNVFSGAGIAHFEDVIEQNIALVFFLPLLVDSGGNAGSQAATLMIRSMALGDVKLTDWLKLFTKEISISFLLGLTMALAVSVVGFFRGGPEIAVVVALTMTVVVMVGSLIGMSLPFIFNKMKMDPATASAPLITSLADIIGVVIYFSIATWYLGLS